MTIQDVLPVGETETALLPAKEKSKAQSRLKKITDKYGDDLLLANVLVTSRDGPMVCGSTSYGKRFVWVGSGGADCKSLFSVTLTIGDKPVFSGGPVEKALEYLTNEGLFKKLAA